MDHITEREMPASFDDVLGWFFPRDQAVVTWLLDRQERLEPPGDLVEMGAYMGKSAIVIGTHLRPGETFTVCDLFGDSLDGDDAVRAEQDWAYNNLTRQAFERNYLAFHESLPTLIQAPTSAILNHVKPNSCRFVHVDASHMYEHVAPDIAAARTLLRTDGVVVCDDFRAEHTPGVAAAVWNAVASGGLRPICVTSSKFSGTWDDPTEVQDEMITWLRSYEANPCEVQDIMGHRVIRVCPWDDAPVPTVPPLHPPVIDEPAVETAPPRARTRTWSAKGIARELLPPLVTKAIKKARRR